MCIRHACAFAQMCSLGVFVEFMFPFPLNSGIHLWIQASILFNFGPLNSCKAYRSSNGKTVYHWGVSSCQFSAGCWFCFFTLARCSSHMVRCSISQLQRQVADYVWSIALFYVRDQLFVLSSTRWLVRCQPLLFRSNCGSAFGSTAGFTTQASLRIFITLCGTPLVELSAGGAASVDVLLGKVVWSATMSTMRCFCSKLSKKQNVWKVWHCHLAFAAGFGGSQCLN